MLFASDVPLSLTGINASLPLGCNRPPFSASIVLLVVVSLTIPGVLTGSSFFVGELSSSALGFGGFSSSLAALVLPVALASLGSVSLAFPSIVLFISSVLLPPVCTSSLSAVGCNKGPFSSSIVALLFVSFLSLLALSRVTSTVSFSSCSCCSPISPSDCSSSSESREGSRGIVALVLLLSSSSSKLLTSSSDSTYPLFSS